MADNTQVVSALAVLTDLTASEIAEKLEAPKSSELVMSHFQHLRWPKFCAKHYNKSLILWQKLTKQVLKRLFQLALCEFLLG